MLDVSQLNTYYGESHVIHDISLQVNPRESVAIMGRNGMGKTTLLKSLIGLLPTRSGDIQLDGRPITGLPSHRRVQHGTGVTFAEDESVAVGPVRLSRVVLHEAAEEQRCDDLRGRHAA